MKVNVGFCARTLLEQRINFITSYPLLVFITTFNFMLKSFIFHSFILDKITEF